MWGATYDIAYTQDQLDVSIHAPRVGCDKLLLLLLKRIKAFQFTHPVWGATSDGADDCRRYASFNSRTPCGVRHLTCNRQVTPQYVSIHAPRVGCDSICRIIKQFRNGFNSRTPCGVRPKMHNDIIERRMFQFTHPVWGATTDGADDCRCYACFNSRTPCGVRLLIKFKF